MPSNLAASFLLNCVRVNAANSTNATTAVVYILFPAKYGGTGRPSAIQD